MTQAKQKSVTLPSEPQEALQQLIQISEKLLMLTQKEAEALALNDLLGFAIMQGEKEVLVNTYVDTSAAFRNRIEDFRQVDPELLDKLNNIQKKLGKLSRQNNDVVAKVKRHSQNKTQKTLLTAQELAQTHPVYFPNKETGEQERI